MFCSHLVFRYGISAAHARYYVQQKRFSVCPNETFMAQLREYEPIYKAMQMVPPRPLPPLANKRQYEDVGDHEESDPDGQGQFKIPHNQ